MTTLEDPLIALRQTIKAKEPITYTDASSTPTPTLTTATHLILTSQKPYPKTTPTRLRKPGVSSSDPSTYPADFFTLEAVYLAWKCREASGAEYMKQVRENGLSVGFVSVTERKGVVDWLEGRVADLERIVPLPSESTTPPGTPPQLKGVGSTVAATPSKATRGLTTASPQKRRYVADSADVEVVKKIKANEIELRDRNTVLRGTKINNYTNVRHAFVEKLKAAKQLSKSSTLPSTSTGSTPTPRPKHKYAYPIIIISSSPTALITMHNVKRFLQDSVYEPSQEARARAMKEGNAKPEDMIPIYRKRSTMDSAGRELETNLRYYVVDSTEALAKFGADAWDRVVCVMTTGQTWQFKPYKWSDPKVLFHHVKGCYISLTTDSTNPKVKDWNVTELKVDPHRRHVDRAVVAAFWKMLDDWIVSNKPWLAK